MFNKLSWDPVSRVRTNFSLAVVADQGRRVHLPRPNAYAPDTTTLSLAAMDPHRNSGLLPAAVELHGPGGYQRDADTSLLTDSRRPVLGQLQDHRASRILIIDYLPDLGRQLCRRFRRLCGSPKATPTSRGSRITDYDIVTRTFVQTDFSKFGNFLGQHNLKGGWGFTKTVNRMNDHEMGGGYIDVYWDTPVAQRRLRRTAARTATTNSTIAAPRAAPARACTTCSSRTSGGLPSA